MSSWQTIIWHITPISFAGLFPVWSPITMSRGKMFKSGYLHVTCLCTFILYKWFSEIYRQISSGIAFYTCAPQKQHGSSDQGEAAFLFTIDYFWNYVDIQVEADILWIKQKACGVPCLSIGELHYYKLFHLTYVCYSWPVCCMEEHKTFTRFWSIKGTHQVTVIIPHP